MVDAVLDKKSPKKRGLTKPSVNPPRFNNQKSLGEMNQTPGLQTLYATDTAFPYRTLKHPPHLPAGPCKPDCPVPLTERRNGHIFSKPDICTDYAGDVRRE